MTNKPRITQFPIVVHPCLSRVATDSRDIFSKYEFYALNFARYIENADAKLVIIFEKHQRLEFATAKNEYPHLILVPIETSRIFFIFFVWKSLRKLKQMRIEPSTIIAGDLWVGSLSSLLMSKFFQNRPKTQIAIHGNPLVASTGITKKARHLFLRYSLRCYTSVRVVSSHLKSWVEDNYGVASQRIFISPIPIMKKPLFNLRDFKIPTIGLVGRLQKERGLNAAFDVIQNLSELNLNFKVRVVGDGPERKKIEQRLESSLRDLDIEFVGALSQDQVRNIWEEIDILISMAPSEGYGLAIREALLSGAIVVALENLGTKEVVEQYSSGIHLVKDVQEAVGIISKIFTKPASYTPSVDLRSLQEEIEFSALDELAKSWST